MTETADSRLTHLIWLFEELEPNTIITPDYLVKGTSLQTLATTGAGGYQRVVEWAEEKLKAKTNSMEKVSDVVLVREQADQCIELLKGRNAKYGDSWRQLRLGSIVDLMMMKLYRCQNQELDQKATEVELEDVVNYGLLALVKLRSKV